MIKKLLVLPIILTSQICLGSNQVSDNPMSYSCTSQESIINEFFQLQSGNAEITGGCLATVGGKNTLYVKGATTVQVNFPNSYLKSESLKLAKFIDKTTGMQIGYTPETLTNDWIHDGNVRIEYDIKNLATGLIERTGVKKLLNTNFSYKAKCNEATFQAYSVKPRFILNNNQIPFHDINAFDMIVDCR